MKTKPWSDCAAFHGHECGGLTIGWKAALYAIKLLDIGARRTRRSSASARTTPAA